MESTLLHFSEDPAIQSFRPRKHISYPELPPMVWAIDTARSPMYLLPRDCPRIAFWAVDNSSPADVTRFIGDTSASMVIAVASQWFQRIQNCRLYVYTFPAETFELFDEGAGYYVSHQTVNPLSVEAVGDLVPVLLSRGVELRFTPSLFPLQESLLKSTLHFSMIRMKNA